MRTYGGISFWFYRIRDVPRLRMFDNTSIIRKSLAKICNKYRCACLQYDTTTYILRVTSNDLGTRYWTRPSVSRTIFPLRNSRTTVSYRTGISSIRRR